MNVVAIHLLGLDAHTAVELLTMAPLLGFGPVRRLLRVEMPPERRTV